MKTKHKIKSAMIQFSDGRNIENPKVIVTEHPDPLSEAERLPNWMALHYEAEKVKDLPAIEISMFVAIWEMAIVYKIPPHVIHEEMLKIPEYKKYFGDIKKWSAGQTGLKFQYENG